MMQWHRRIKTLWTKPDRRVRRAGFAAVALAALLVAPAARAAAPVLLPQRMVTVSYALDSHETGPVQVELRADPAARLIRLDQAGLGDYLLLDFAGDSVRLVSPQKGIVFAVAPAGLDAITHAGADSLHLRPGVERRLLGLACRVWHGSERGGQGEACITPEGVILAASAFGTPPGGSGPEKGQLSATAVSFAPIPRDVFAVPTGLQVVNLPPALFRAMVPGLAGLGAP